MKILERTHAVYERTLQRLSRRGAADLDAVTPAVRAILDDVRARREWPGEAPGPDDPPVDADLVTRRGRHLERALPPAQLHAPGHRLGALHGGGAAAAAAASAAPTLRLLLLLRRLAAAAHGGRA